MQEETTSGSQTVAEINTSNLYEVNSTMWSGNINCNLLLSSFGKENIDNYINDPMTYHNELNNVIETMYNSNGILAQTISKMVAAPTLGYIMTPNKPTKGNITRRIKANELLNKLNHAYITRDSLFSHLLFGESVFILHENVDKNKKQQTMLKPLHRDFVKFEGTANGDNIVAFDLEYFNWEAFQDNDDYIVREPADILKTFPLEFTKAFDAYTKDNSKRWLILEQKTTYSTKFRAGFLERHGRSIALSALVDMLFAQEYTESQRSNLQKYSSELLYMEHPAGEKVGSCSLNGEQQKKQLLTFLDATKKQSDRTSGYAPRSTAFGVAPGTKIHKIEVNPALLKDTLKKENNEQISSDLGLGLGSISGNGGAGNYSSLQLNMDLVMAEVYQFLEQAEKQYEKLINYIMKSDESNHIKFRYLKASNHNRKDAFQRAKELYTMASGSREYLYATVFDDAQTYIELMETETLIDYDSKFLPHITSFTATESGDNPNPDGNLGGRPQKDATDMTDKGLETRSNGGNKAVKPSTS